MLLAVLAGLLVVPAGGPLGKRDFVAEAPDEASAVTAAQVQHSRVAVAKLTSESRQVFAEPDGRMTAEFSAVPVRVKRAGGWVPVDTTLARESDGVVRPTAALGDVELSSGGAGPVVTVRQDGQKVALSWPGRLPEPVLVGDTATYRDVLAGVDLVMVAERDGVAVRFVVHSAQAASNPALAALGLRVDAGDLTVTVDEAGVIRAVDKAGKERFSAPASVMWDASGENAATARSAAVGVGLSDGVLTLRPDLAFLADAATVFPVVIDPRLHTPGWNNWATVLSGSKVSGSSFPRTSGAGPDFGQVGKCYIPSGECKDIGVARYYMQFDTTGLTGAQTLFDAAVLVQVANSPNCSARRQDLHWVHGQLTDGLTWNNQPGPDSLASVDAPPVHGCVNENGAVRIGFDVKAVTRGGFSAFYLQAYDENDQLAWRRYYSAATKLTVTYNTPPDPAYQLSTDPPMKAPCRWCDGKSYVADDFIRLQTRLSDADGDSVKPQWNIWRNGVLEDRWGSLQMPGAAHTTDVDLRGMDGQEADWYVRGWDVWSDGSLAQTNEWRRGPGPFVVDRVGPGVKPSVKGLLYQNDNRWHGGVGVAGKFTFDTSDTPNVTVPDIDHYLYGWNDPPSDGPLNRVDADRLGGPATVTLTPPGDGPRDLYVQSVDRAGHRSDTKVYHFYVRPGNGPLAQWSFEGNTKDDANLGFRDGTPNGNVIYGPGAVGSAVRLDGTGACVTAPNTVRTDASFSMSAWVKLDRVDDGSYAVVSQDGTSVAGASVEYEGTNKRWVFVMTAFDGSYSNVFVARSSTLAVAGEWTHLTGTYDGASQQMRLYVNGVLAGSAGRQTTPWNAEGLLRIGQEKQGTGYGKYWPGSIDEVHAYDRVLTDAEVRAAVSRDNVQIGHWKFDEPDGTTATNAIPGGDMLVLENGATFAEHGASNNAVQLDGVDDQVSAGGPVLRTDQSFSVAAWVKVDRHLDPGATVTVLSQDGDKVSGFSLGYREVDGGRWEFSMPAVDGDQPGGVMVRSTELAVVGTKDWTHLTAVYDAPSKQLRLYVGGRLAGPATASSVVKATGKFVIGRGKRNGLPGNFWPGGVDELRAFSRAISIEEIQGIVSGENVKALSWKLDGDAKDSSGREDPHSGTVMGGAAWTGGQNANPDPDDLAVNLDGADDFVTSTKAVDTQGSFSVAAWVKLTSKPDGWAAVASQNGAHSSMFWLGYTGKADDHWAFAMHGSDVDSPTAVRVRSAETPQVGVWTHLAVVYQASTGDMLLYVNGVLSATGSSTTPWNATSSFDVGRARWATAWGNFLPAAVDDVQVYGRSLFADEVRAMAGRDLTLVHDWRLDESSGTTLGDAVGTRPATLNPGATFAPGRVGNAVKFDGTTGTVTSTGVDLRTDDSFTVAAWAYLPDQQCDLATASECRRTVLSVDGTRTSKFRLGHVVDQDHLRGYWTFEMPESDTDNAPITQAAVDVAPADVNAWVHLVGVYDKQAKTIRLYVDGTRRGDGTVNTPWQASGGVAIGRGKVNGAAAQFWPGTVDDVRLYTGPLTGDRIDELYGSYPAENGGGTGMPTADAGYWTFDEASGNTAADSSGRGLTATIKGGGERFNGRKGRAAWFDAVPGYAETTGPVLDATRDFSMTAWAYLADTTADRTVLGQDGSQESAFRLQYNASTGKWAIAVPAAGSSPAVLLTSPQSAVAHEWTHLAVVYNAGLHQLRLYVNGVLSAAQVGVTIGNAAGPLSMGRAKRAGANAEFFWSGIDDVRAFGKPLGDSEVTAVHDDVPTMDYGGWRFDEATGKDYSWRHDDATASGGVSYGPGMIRKAIQLDGINGQATTTRSVTPFNESFTVSAWARLTRTDRAATVLSQDGGRMSGFVLQYRPEIGRWVFGAPPNDTDSAGLLYAQSTAPAVANRWTHLVGVYDYGKRQLRLYVDGQLAGARSEVALWQASGGFAIGRGKINGSPAEFLTGAADEVHAFLGIATDTQIQTLARYPEPPDGQLGRTVNAAGDRSSTTTSEAMPDGYHFDTSLGMLAADGQPNTRVLYSCKFGSDAFTSADPACEGKTVVGEIGRVYTAAPTNLPSLAIYRCRTASDHFDSTRSDCEGATKDGLLGYTLAYAPLTRYYSAFDYDHFDTVHGGPVGYENGGVAGLVAMIPQPGTQPLTSCVNGVDTFLSTDPACEGKTVLGSLGQIWTAAPADTASTPLYRCVVNNEYFASTSANCEGYTLDRQLGFILTGLPAAAGRS
ncbi:LamG-like jellyroll fold domain-containing protein [Actinocrispum wychmicini]|uniref:LamG-like jellyroll fold domain-containing protein n=1 Tax=Actinocrispum wychmicini TaxID=1213861 RepID=UPI001FB80596|nr:LamG-like jellyroll fold domain-containing protein [Actinocrispum wychmicini]